jgi:hypothetical protein
MSGNRLAHGEGEDTTMRRRFFSVAAGLTLCALSISAAEQATFVLTNGQRQSGTVIYGRGDNNIVDGRFHLNVGGDISFGINDVAVIDFAGGEPSAAEQQALPNDATGLMVMRNGSTQRGHLHNLISNDMVQWVNEAGQRNNYPIRDVSRLYLNAQVARSVFLRSSAAPATAAAPPQNGASPRTRQDPRQDTGTTRTIRVNANQSFTDTGFTVSRGDRVVFNVSGVVGVGAGSGLSGAAGNPSIRSRDLPSPSAPAGELIANVGGAIIDIGQETRAITMPMDGRLLLGVNDTRFDDNTGFFTVTIAQMQGNRGSFEEPADNGDSRGQGRRDRSRR